MNNMKMKALIILLVIFTLALAASAQTTNFTYQGKLTDSGTAANGIYDLQFAIFDDNGNAVGDSIIREDVTVASGVFTVQLDFGESVFTNDARLLEISVRRGAETGAFTPLTPRQPITAAPFSIRALNATNALNVDGTPAAQVIKEGDARLIDERTPLAGSTNYVQNTTQQQASTDFNVSGGGTANVFNARTQFSIGGSRVLSIDAGQNTFVGKNTGTSNIAGALNLFVGENAGQANITGGSNSFVGFNAGYNNADGSDNSFFGRNSGFNNLSGSRNSFFGRTSGFFNVSGSGNSFFGYQAGNNNTTGDTNSFFGRDAGTVNNTGSENTFIGVDAGFRNTSGSSNTFVGRQAGLTNTTGTFNTIIGTNANLLTNNLTYATAIGAGATVGTNNTVVLGREVDSVQIPGGLNVGSFSADIVSARLQFNLDSQRILSAPGTENLFVGFNSGTSNSGSRNLFLGIYSGFRNTSGSDNLFFGVSSGLANKTGNSNLFFGNSAGFNSIDGNFNVYLGHSAGISSKGSNNVLIGSSTGFFNTTGNYNTLIGSDANTANTGFTYATAIGAGSSAFSSNSISFGRSNGSDTLVIYGKVKVLQLGFGTSNTLICQNANNELINCLRTLALTTNGVPFTAGLSLINQLKPISFASEEGGKQRFGLDADEKTRANPLLNDFDSKNPDEIVLSDRLNAAFVNAFKEQQAQIESQQQQIRDQQKQIEELKKLVCAQFPTAALCR